MSASDGSDICPLGAAVVSTLAIAGHLRRLCTPVFTRSEIHHWCAVGQELIVVPFFSSVLLVEPLGETVLRVSSILCGTLVLGKPLYDRIGECNLSVPFPRV